MRHFHNPTLSLFFLVSSLCLGCSIIDDRDDNDVDELATVESDLLGTGERAGWVTMSLEAGGVDGAHSYNSSLGSVGVVHVGTGLYTVQFGGALGSGGGGNVQVSAIGSGNQRCKVESWFGSNPLNVRVRCHNGAGILTDSRFVVSYAAFAGGNTYSDRGAYVWMNQPTGGILSPTYMWGDSISVVHAGTGAYVLSFAGHTLDAGNILVTAYGTGSEYCNIYNWQNSQAFVLCFRSGGVPADSAFTLRYTLGTAATCRGGASSNGIHDTKWSSGAYARSYGVVLPDPYNFNVIHEAPPGCRCRLTGINTIDQTGVGHYSVSFGNFGNSPLFSAAQIPVVTAFGPTTAYCKIAEFPWNETSSANAIVRFKCWDSNGTALSNSPFSVMFLSNQYIIC